MESVSAGTAYGLATLGDYVGQLKYIFTEKGASSIGGFGAIGNMFPATWDWQRFWENTALISDYSCLYEHTSYSGFGWWTRCVLAIRNGNRKRSATKVLEVAQYVGIVLLLTLMVYANGNDIYKFFAG